MASLARCYEPEINLYSHRNVTEVLGITEADRAIRLTHKLVWDDWMRGSFSLREMDFQLFLSEDSFKVLQNKRLLQVQSVFLGFAPTAAVSSDRALFSITLQNMLKKSQNQCLYKGEASSVNDALGPVPLTPRETEILLLIGKGLTSKEIAVLLNLTITTIGSYRKNICSKLDLHSTASLASYLYRKKNNIYSS